MRLTKLLTPLTLALSVFLISCGGDDSGSVTPFEASVSLSVNNNDINETGGTATVTITSSTQNTSGTAIPIPVSVSGTATEGTDYSIGTASLAAGESTATLTISTIDDFDEEGDETVVVEINDASLDEVLTVSGGSITVTINEDCDSGVNGDSIDQDNHDCENPAFMTSYTETFASANVRQIVTTGRPNHTWRNQIPMLVSELDNSDKTYTMVDPPALAASQTSVLDANTGRPKWVFGVALNGVKIDPAPAEPFIWEDLSGEYNWDWVMEPNNNMDAVGLDCAVAHVQPDGQYHYHGDFAIYADIRLAGLGAGTTTPANPDQAFIGWAGDGFPILYKFGPDGSGGITSLEPSYRLKTGERPGDGDSEPCGIYNGKYTNDYEYVEGLGDLDECNGISRQVSITTDAEGEPETFDYFYVVTDNHPILPRCFSGTPDDSFLLNQSAPGDHFGN